MTGIATCKCFFFLTSDFFYSCLLTLLLSLGKGIPSFNFPSLLLYSKMLRNCRDCHGRKKESNVASIYYKSPILPQNNSVLLLAQRRFHQGIFLPTYTSINSANIFVKCTVIISATQSRPYRSHSFNFKIPGSHVLENLMTLFQLFRRRLPDVLLCSHMCTHG